MAAGPLGTVRMNCCGEWTGQIHLEAVLVSAGVMFWWGIRGPQHQVGTTTSAVV